MKVYVIVDQSLWLLWKCNNFKQMSKWLIQYYLLLFYGPNCAVLVNSHWSHSVSIKADKQCCSLSTGWVNKQPFCNLGDKMSVLCSRLVSTFNKWPKHSRFLCMYEVCISLMSPSQEVYPSFDQKEISGYAYVTY